MRPSACSRVFSLPRPPTSWKKSRAEGHDSWCLAQGCGLSYGPRTTGVLDGHTERAIRAPNRAQPQANRIQTRPTAGAASMGRVVLLTLWIGGILGRSAGCAGGVVWPRGWGERAAWAIHRLAWSAICLPSRSMAVAVPWKERGKCPGAGARRVELGGLACHDAGYRQGGRGSAQEPRALACLGLVPLQWTHLATASNVAPVSRAHDLGS